jgi:predicted transcriptional regulator
MSFKLLLRRISEKVSPGRSPSYSEAQVLRALELSSGNGIGRASLGTRLGIGEGVVRTLTKHLVTEGLIERSNRGITISKKGRKLLTEIHSLIPNGVEVPVTNDVLGEHSYAVLVKGVAENVRFGVEQRDAALLAGAMGATTIVFKGRSAVMPGMDREPSPSLLAFLIEGMRPAEEDVVILGTGDTLIEAQIGAYSAALTLV